MLEHSYGALVSSRPISSSLAGLLAASVYWQTSPNQEIGVAAALFLAVLLTSAFGFMYNDLVDEEKDLYRTDPRPLQLGLVGRQFLFATSICCAVSAVAIAGVIGHGAFWIVFGTCALLYLYSYTNRISGIGSNLITGACTSLIFVLAMTAGTYSPTFALMSVAAFLFTVAREIVLDLKDLDSDERFGKPSVPRAVGAERTLQLVAGLSLISCAIFLTATGLQKSPALQIISGGGVTIMILVATYQLVHSGVAGIQRYVSTTRLAFLTLSAGIFMAASTTG